MKKIVLLLTFLLVPFFTQKLDAQCTDTNLGSGNQIISTSMGQSFAATCSGTLNSIGVFVKTITTGHTLTVYSGDGTGGTNLGSVAFDFTGLAATNLTTDFKSIDISSEGISLTSGSTYTFVISGAQQNLYYNNGDNRADGQMYFDGVAASSLDLMFNINISAASGTTVDFNSAGLVDNIDFGASFITVSGYKFTYSGSNIFGRTLGSGGSMGIYMAAFSGSPETLTIESADGSEFDLESFFVNVFKFNGAGTYTAEGFKDTNSVGSQALSVTGNTTTGVSQTVSPNSTFDDVDKVVITSTATGFFNVFDDFVFGSAVTGPVLNAYIADSGNDAIYKVNLNAKSSVTASDQIISGSTVSNGVRDLWLDEISATKKLYFGHEGSGATDKIKRANTDGTSIEDVITGINNIRAIAYDADEAMLYWFDDGTDLLYRSDISTVPLAQSTAESVAVIVGTQGKSIRDIELEISGTNITIYAVASNTNESIFKTTIDRDQSGALSGATWSTLVTGLTLSNFMALDLNNGFLYFSDDQGTGAGNVYRISTSASSTAVSSLTAWSTVASNAPDPLGIDVDLANNAVYFSTSGTTDDLRKGSLSASSSTISTALTGFNAIQEIELEVNNPVAVAGDATPPVFESSTPSAASIAQTGFTLNTDIDEAGTIYYVVVADGAGAPTAANVKAGQASGGGSAVTSGNAAVSSGGFTNAFSVTSLSAASAYDVYVVAQDDEGTPNLQTSAAKIDVTTLAPSSLQVAATAFLEGAYNGSSLNTIINGSIPAQQPYNGTNSHSETTNLTSMPANAVDWVLVELREAGSAAAALNSTKVGSAAGLLMSDGSIKATDGASNLTVSLSGNTGTAYFVVIYHRNHLPIMSASVVSGSSGTLTIDFTSSSANTYQTTTALASLSGSKFGMPAGDIDQDGDIDGTDLGTWRTNNGITFSYGANGAADFNLDGVINGVDRNDFHQKNTSKTRQVPDT